ncbi:flagellar export chaperone FliS [Methylocucumis oryzae]|uniref:flagellar export chaperone FliS n=1 Tax=Methylocucumis oryzae TaxID=1632867 RepID=UPI0009E27A52|nr:flagellar export chaperone FliS [Methylocucumis oryzae]
MNAVSATKRYQQISIQSAVVDASPHRLVQMLMEGVLERIAIAKGNLARKEIALKGENISRAITIINGLQAALNKEAGGELAENLDNLYDYMIMRLINANYSNDESLLDEVNTLMLEIKSGWDNMPDEYKTKRCDHDRIRGHYYSHQAHASIGIAR